MPIQYYPTANQMVEAAIATERVEGVVTKIDIWLASIIALTPTAVEYVEANNLVNEIISKAGMHENTTFTAKNQLSTSTQDNKFLYHLQFLVDTSS